MSSDSGLRYVYNIVINSDREDPNVMADPDYSFRPPPGMVTPIKRTVL